LPGSIKRDDNLTDSLQRFWETESIGTKNDTFSETQTTEFLTELHFDKGEGRYEVNLPWKQDCFPKSTGYGTCVNRLRQLHSRLKKDNTLLEEYNKVIQQQINSGIIESVPEEDDNEGYVLLTTSRSVEVRERDYKSTSGFRWISKTGYRQSIHK
jgi:hypothetical protein